MPCWKCAKADNGTERPFRRLHVNLVQEIRALPPLLLERENHVILVDRLVHRRDLALAERVVERAVDRLRGQAEARGSVAIDDDVRGQAGILLVRTHVHDFRQRRELVENPRAPFGEQIEILRLQRVLILRVALPSADPEVLLGLQIQGCPRHAGRLVTDARDHLVGGRVALFL